MKSDARAFVIRPFETTEDYRACVALQEETWGEGFSERVSPAILKVAQILGGVSAGAYDEDGGLVGFVFGMTGLRDGEVVHWSDMLAVRRGLRDAGLGQRLKIYQREAVMRLGVRKMFWTFDPLRARNAYLNFQKLGIVVREYEENMYGDTDSPLHRGIGTDRFIALWLLDSERVRSRIEGDAGHTEERRGGGSGPAAWSDRFEDVPRALASESSGGHPVPRQPDLGLTDGPVGVEIPSEIATLMDDEPELASGWRSATRTTFRHYLAEGYEVGEFVRGDRVSTYVMVRRSAGSERTPPGGTGGSDGDH